MAHLSPRYVKDAIPKPGLPQNLWLTFQSGSDTKGSIPRDWQRGSGNVASRYILSPSIYKRSSVHIRSQVYVEGVKRRLTLFSRTAGLFFSTYERAKLVLGEFLPVHQALIHSSASGIAEMASCLVLAPAEVIKQNAQMIQQDSLADSGKHARNSSASTSLRAFRQLAAKEAPRRLFTGYTALIARNLPFTALQFPMFEHLRARAWETRLRKTGRSSDDDGEERRGVLETCLIAGGSAGIAGAAAAFVTTPSDVVKTRMMLMAGQRYPSATGTVASSPGRRDGKPLGSWAVTRLIYRERGISGFFRGWVFRSGWTALGSSLYLGTYDGAKLWLRRRRGTHPVAFE